MQFSVDSLNPITNADLTFAKLSDTPSSYVGESGKYVAVAADESTLEFNTITIPTDEINVETLSAHKYLTSDDKKYQWLSSDSTARNRVYLDNSDGVAGDTFIIRNNNTYTSSMDIRLFIQSTFVDYIYAGRIVKLIHDGTTWVAGDNTSSELDDKRYNVTIGVKSRATNKGVAIGYHALGYTLGVAVGYNTDAYNYGAAVGYQAIGYSYGVAVGYISHGGTNGVAVGWSAIGRTDGVAIGRATNTSLKKRSVAIGNYTVCTRTCEMTHNIGGQNNKGYEGIVGWLGTTTNTDPTKIYLGNEDGEELTIASNSVISYKIMVTAKQITPSTNVAYYHFEGVVKRDAASTVTHALNTKTVKYEDDASWDCNTTVSGTALIILCTGNNDSILWSARGDFVEIQGY